MLIITVSVNVYGPVKHVKNQPQDLIPHNILMYFVNVDGHKQSPYQPQLPLIGPSQLFGPYVGNALRTMEDTQMLNVNPVLGGMGHFPWMMKTYAMVTGLVGTTKRTINMFGIALAPIVPPVYLKVVLKTNVQQLGTYVKKIQTVQEHLTVQVDVGLYMVGQ